MKINFEKYIKSNRNQLDNVEDFDVEEMWNDFDKINSPVRMRWMRPWHMIAAAVAVIFIGLLVFINTEDVVSQDDLVFQKLSEIDPELAAEQVDLIEMVSAQDSLIKNIGITEKEFPDLFKEINELDSLQMDYLNDLDNYRDRKNLTRTLLRHYQRKARVLELMLYEFDKQENETTYENAKEI